MTVVSKLTAETVAKQRMAVSKTNKIFQKISYYTVSFQSFSKLPSKILTRAFWYHMLAGEEGPAEGEEERSSGTVYYTLVDQQAQTTWSGHGQY